MTGGAPILSVSVNSLERTYGFSSPSADLAAALRPLFVSTELSSFIRLGGRKPPLPRPGLPWRNLATPAGGSGGGLERLERDGEEKQGWRGYAEDGLSGTSGTFGGSTRLKHSATFSLCWRVAFLARRAFCTSTEGLQQSVSCT